MPNGQLVTSRNFVYPFQQLQKLFPSDLNAATAQAKPTSRQCVRLYRNTKLLNKKIALFCSLPEPSTISVLTGALFFSKELSVTCIAFLG